MSARWPWCRGSGVAWFAAFAASGCQVLFGVDADDLPNPASGGAPAAGSGGASSGGRAGAGGRGGADGKTGQGGMAQGASGDGGSGDLGGQSGSTQGSGGAGGSTQGAGGSAGSGAAGASGSGGGGADVGSGPVVINELYYDAPGADTGSFIELKGPPGASLEGYRLQGVDGNSPPGSFYAELVFNATHAFDANGYFVIAQDDTVPIAAGAAFRINPFANLQNGPDNVVLLGPDDAIVDAVGYTGIGGTFAETLTFVGEGRAASGVAAPKTLSRLPDGADTNDNIVDFLGGQGGQPTPGAPNAPAP
jgi:hypothetical protein